MKRKRIEPWFLVFADFHGANIPTGADIKLPHEVTEQGVGKYCTQQVLTSRYEPVSVYHYLAVNQPLYSVELSSPRKLLWDLYNSRGMSVLCNKNIFKTPS